jgi:hypothetical protein
MDAKNRMYERIFDHGENLNKIFGLTDDPIKTAKMLHRFEVKAHQLATDYCNGVRGINSETWNPAADKILNALDKKINFRKQAIPVFINGDARGYALKIDDDYTKANNLEIHRDWGGYGILAPEFDGKP